MDFLLCFFLISATVFVLIVVHEFGHYLGGLMGGIPASDMRLVLLAFPQHVTLRDGEEWVSPVKDIHRYVEVSRRHLRSRGAAFRYVAAGIVMELFMTGLIWTAAMMADIPRWRSGWPSCP